VLTDTGQEHHTSPCTKDQMMAGSFHHKDCLKHFAAIEMVLFPENNVQKILPCQNWIDQHHMWFQVVTEFSKARDLGTSFSVVNVH